jgi:hypothetical protein
VDARQTARPTPSPSPVAGAWLRRDFPTDGNVAAEDLWSVDGSFVMLADTDGHSVFLSSSDGRSWNPWAPSPAIVSYWAGTVIDGDLWFVATVAGVTSTHFELVQTKDGGSMQSLGVAKGAAPDWIGFLDRVNGTWVMTHGQYLPDGEGAGREDFEVSDDGVHWTTIAPDGLRGLLYRHAGHLGRKLVVIADRAGPETGRISLVSTDGRSWRSAAFPGGVAASGAILDMACTTTACVAVGTGTQGLVDLPIVVVTTDGLHWTEIPSEVTRGTATTLMQAVVATDRGFVAVGGGEGWLSADGSQWQNFLVMPVNSGQVSLLAARGDRLLAFGVDGAGVPATWLGSLSAIGG